MEQKLAKATWLKLITDLLRILIIPFIAAAFFYKSIGATDPEWVQYMFLAILTLILNELCVLNTNIKDGLVKQIITIVQAKEGEVAHNEKDIKNGEGIVREATEGKG